LGVLVSSAREDLESISKLRISTLHRQCLWRESKTSERDFLYKPEAVASKFFLLPKEKKGAEAPKVLSSLKRGEGARAPKVLRRETLDPKIPWPKGQKF